MDNVKNAHLQKLSRKICINGFEGDQRGFNVIESLIFIAIIVLVAVIVVPNVNMCFGKQTEIDEANVEAANVRAAATAYEINNGKYPTSSDQLWSNPASPCDYIGEPRAVYTFDAGTGRITSATTNDGLTTSAPDLPADAWTGIQWDSDTGSWVK
jgi:type II secretory pathway pseudopilin PulG